MPLPLVELFQGRCVPGALSWIVEGLFHIEIVVDSIS